MKKLKYALLAMLFVSFFYGTQAQRDTIKINTDWKFKIDNDGAGNQQRWFLKPLTDTREVKVPHTWNIETENQNHYGWGWYEKTVFAPAFWKTKNVVLVFGAVNHSAYIYLNGEKIGEHVGDGFNKFFINLNGKLKYGKSNRITVAVNNDYGRNKVPFGSSFDWPNDGGIIRPVSFIVSGMPAANYIHVTPTLLPNWTDGKMNITLGFDKPQTNLEYHVTITEDNQPTSKKVYEQTVVPQWNQDEAGFNLELKNIHPWQFDFPNLYRVDVTVLKDRKTVDRLSASVGFRKIDFVDGQTYLNGEPVKLMGVEWTAGSNPDFGFAESDSQIIAMGKLMKNVNAIFSRQHFQQGDVFYNFCDRNGIIVQQEVPLWGGETPANDTIRRIAMSQMKEMITNLYNHPSIFSWGAGNELRGRDPKMIAIIKDLISEARSLDTSRHAAYVSNTLTYGFYNTPGFVPDAASDGDYLMMNEYGTSWWSLPAGQIGYYLDSIHTTYPKMPFFISEFGLCEPNFRGGDERRLQDMIYHMSLFESKPFVQGAIYFDLTDYRTHYPGTSDNDKFRRRIHGVYDMYGNPKPSMKVLREMSSPLEVQNLISSGKGKQKVLIFGSMGLPQYTTHGYKLYVSTHENNYHLSRPYAIPELKPGQSAYVEVNEVNNGNCFITVVSPLGYVTSQKSFYETND